jgi:release factor glutamine methyltransferase
MLKTRGSLVAEVAGALLSAGFEEPRRFARRLVASALAISQADLFAHPDQFLDEQQVGGIRIMLGRMLKREPLSRILGRREFWGLEFALSTETLDPRPETETIVEAVLMRNPDCGAPLRVLDLGTGTGCLLLALLSEFPAASGVGVDIAEDAVRTAARNALALGLADRAFFLVGDWGAAISAKFDVVVANPPYIASGDLWLLPREVVYHDPWRALDGGKDGLGAYRVITRHLPMLLAPDGIFVTEIGVDQADSVSGVIRTNGLVLDGIEKDLAAVPRCAIARPAR